MTTYVLSCELNQKYNQDEFFATMNSLGEIKQFSSSTWFLITEKTSKEIRDALASAMEGSERLLVMKSASPAAWRNAMCDNKWIIENISNK